MGCTKNRSCLELGFIACNVLFLLCGIFLFGVGIYFQVSRSDFLEVLDSMIFRKATALLVAAGIIVVALSLFGIGMFAIKHVLVGLLSIYASIIFLLIVLQCVAGGLSLYMYNNIAKDLKSDMMDGLRDPAKKTAWDNAQSLYKCCGVNNASDWEGVHDKTKISTIPDSCCGYENCGQTGVAAAYRIGCFTDAKEWLQVNYIWIGVVGVAVAVLQLFLLIAPLVMICQRACPGGCCNSEPEYLGGPYAQQYQAQQYHDNMGAKLT